ncbi:MAG: AMP-binding protein, partial [Sphingomonas sp.]
AATSSVCFDPSMIEIFAPLSLGGCLILKQNLLEPFAPDECPTLIQGVPSVLDELARNGAIPDSVRVIHSGGEALSAAVARRIYRGSRAARLYNHYGPTEATVAATVQLVDRESVGDPSIGTAVGGARLHLLDETGRPVATGQTGELHIAGDGLARGYWQRPDLTGACFVPELDGPAGSRMYRTGDLARMTTAGELMFVGRRERQVKIRGCRVELGEVEQAVRARAQVDEAVVTLAADSARRDRLIAFVRAAPAFDGVAARGELARWLPRYMLPSRLVVVDDLPRSATGKVDHAALAALVPAIPIDPANDAESSDSALERIVAETFATLLGIPAVGVDDDFFDLGGDSLAAFQLAMELEQRFGRPISPTIVAQASTARTLAALLDVTALCDEDHLCLLADGAGEQPVFCLPDVSGEPFSCMALAERLGRRCYGLSPGPLAAAFVADGDMAQLTTAYAAEVLRVQPEGPCIVLGYSFGGIEAFDLAVALERTGKSVTLVLIDGFLSRDLTAPAILVPWLLRDGLRYVREEGRAAMLHRLATSRWLPWGRADREVPSWIAPRRRALAEALSAATGRYEPQPFHGRTIMVAAGERNAFERLLDHDRHQGWRPWLRGEVAIRTVQATHNGLMRRPHVDETAAAVLAMLAEMEERSPQPEPAAVVEPPLILAGAARR